MPWPALADHRSGGDVQGREETGGAMAFVVVGAALHLAGQHRKDRLAAAQRLNLTLLIHAQHQRTMRRIQVQERFRHIPTVKPVVRSLAATAALLRPPEHSRMTRARKARDREFRGCCNNCRKVTFCSGLTTSSRFLGRPRGFGMIHDLSLIHISEPTRQAEISYAV